jgi:hypothetical protein
MHAVLGLLAGLAGVLAFAGALGWLIAWAGLLLSALGLWRIARNAPHLSGRGAALVGLTLSTLFVAAAPVEWRAYQQMVDDEAVRFARYWFDFLSHQQPQKAFQLTLHPHLRQPLDASLWDFYRQGVRWHNELDDYVSQPVVRTLLALGPRAETRFYQIDRQERDRDHDLVWPIFAVTYDEQGKRKTFFVRLLLERLHLHGQDREKRPTALADWKIHQVEGGIEPAGWIPDAISPN